MSLVAIGEPSRLASSGRVSLVVIVAYLPSAVSGPDAPFLSLQYSRQ
jgi:hypothetical protein